MSIEKAKKLTAEQVFAKYNPVSEYVAVYVPSTRYNKPIDNSKWLEMAKHELSQLLGGCTVYKTEGGYIADSGEYISEAIDIVKSYGNITAEIAKRILEIANKIKLEMEQECVSIEYNGSIMFV